MKQYDEKKICFIVYAENKQYLEECILYLSLLEIPDGYEAELLVVEGNSSMANGYNEAMETSDAKYKVYMRQQAFVVEKQLISKLLEIFKADESIGMIGVLGCQDLSKDALVHHSELYGELRNAEKYKKGLRINEISSWLQEVETIDDLFMATQYDIIWRDDVLEEQAFCDVSQSLEFQKRGYKVVVSAQEEAWVLYAGSERECMYHESCPSKIFKEYSTFFEKKKRLRILFVHSEQIKLLGIGAALITLGHELTEYSTRINMLLIEREQVEQLEEDLEEGNYDLVVSYDFIPAVSNACESMKVKYYSWVYDSPLILLYTNEVKNSINYISMFDKKQCERLISQGIPHLKHFPLATEVDMFSGIAIEPGDEKKYRAEVSFVGGLYDNGGYTELLENGPTEYMQEAEDIVRSGLCMWNGTSHIFEKTSDGLVEYLVQQVGRETLNHYNIDARYYCESIKLARKCNEYERIAVLNEVAQRFEMVLYTTNAERKDLKNVIIRPRINYLLEMPKVFYLSKINLNISSRSIETGIPQRVWDIMAVGGFCLTNYQTEIEDYFEIGTDIEVYHNLQELIEKIDYYLKHEEARVRIAMNGYKKVRRLHSYEQRMSEVLEWICEE